MTASSLYPIKRSIQFFDFQHIALIPYQVAFGLYGFRLLFLYYLGRRYENKIEHFGARQTYLPEEPLIL